VVGDLNSAKSPADHIVHLERLLKVKDAQLEDARSVAAAMAANVERNEKVVAQLRAVVERGRQGSATLSAKLRAEIEQESDISSRLAAEEAEVRQLEVSLEETRKEADDPALARWVERRAEDVGAMLDSRESARELGRAVYAAVDGVRGSVKSLEERAEARVSPAAAVLLTALVVLLPCLAACWAFSRLTKSISYRQHVLVGHIGNAVFVAVCAVLTAASGYDPLVAMHHSSPLRALVLMVFFCVQWPVMVGLMVCCVLDGKNSNERESFVSQIVLFVAVCVHASRNTYGRILSGAATPSLGQGNFKNYVLYIFSVCAMILLTVSAADERQEGLIQDVRQMFGDDEAVKGGKRGTASPRPSTARSRLSASAADDGAGGKFA
jgi:hypothetical protein